MLLPSCHPIIVLHGCSADLWSMGCPSWMRTEMLLHKLYARLAFVVVALLTVLAPAQIASAHAILLTSEPAPSAVLDQSPIEISLFFNEFIDTVFGEIRILDSSGNVIESVKPVRDVANEAIVRAPISTLEEGTYVVVWRVASADSHPVQGSFAFQIGNTSSDVSAISKYQELERHGLASLFNVIRWVTYLGVVLLIGGIGLLQAVRTDRLSPRSTLALMGGWVFAALGTLEGLIAYGPHISGLKIYEAVDLSLLLETLTTQYGKMQLARLVLLGIIGALIAVIKFRGTWWWKFGAWASLVGVTLTLSMAGHPVATNPVALSVGLDMLHMLAVSLWVGPLLIIVYDRNMWLATDESTSAPSLRWFSRTAGFAVPVIVVTGVIQAWLILDGFGQILESRYGRTLIVKVCLVVVLIALGAVSRVAMQRKQSGSLRQSMGIEVLFGLIILALTSTLVAMPPKGELEPAPLSSTIFQGQMIVELSLTSARVGQSEVHVVVARADGTFVQIEAATARMSMPSRNIPNGPIVLKETGPNHFSGVTEFAYSGEWVVEMLVKQTASSTTLFKIAVEIKK
ncbi:MAG: copper resistance protein CopC [Acidimicrobiia bacterium]